MENQSTIACVLAIATIAFMAGRWSKPATVSTDNTKGSQKGAETSPARTPAATPVRETSRAVREKEAREAAATGENLTREQCLLLTSEERLNLMRKGALIFDGLKQAAYLEGVIGSLSLEELNLSVNILGKAQTRGNYCAQGVWDTLWKQAGRLDPEATLASFGQGKSRSDARHVMEGWFETDAAAAAAWAQSPKETFHEAAAAAYLLTRSADGDADKLIESLTTLNPNEMVLKDCLQDYFDLADVSGTSEGTAAIYDDLPASMKPYAWSVTMRRLSYTDAQEAVDWLAKHADEPGRDYRHTQRLFNELASDDPAGTTAWAASLPDSGNESNSHPAVIGYQHWRRADAGAAAAWLETIDQSTAWAQRLRALR